MKRLYKYRKIVLAFGTFMLLAALGLKLSAISGAGILFLIGWAIPFVYLYQHSNCSVLCISKDV